MYSTNTLGQKPNLCYDKKNVALTFTWWSTFSPVTIYSNTRLTLSVSVLLRYAWNTPADIIQVRTAPWPTLCGWSLPDICINRKSEGSYSNAHDQSFVEQCFYRWNGSGLTCGGMNAWMKKPKILYCIDTVQYFVSVLFLFFKLKKDAIDAAVNWLANRLYVWQLKQGALSWLILY